MIRICAAAAALLSLAMAAGCGGGEEAKEAPRAWKGRTVWKSEHKIQAATAGDADPSSEGLEIVAVDAVGQTMMVRLADGASAELVYHHQAKLTGLLVADVDASLPGEEVYAGGYRTGEEGGAVVQVHCGADGTVSRRIWEGPGFVHALEPMAPPPGGGAKRLLVITYAGTVHALAPSGGREPWSDRVIHTEPPNDDPEMRKIKDVIAGPLGGVERPRVFVAVKSGRGVLLDPDGGAEPELLHTEPGGLARLALAGDGTFYAAANNGRVLYFGRASGSWKAETVYEEPDQLRGIACGTFSTDAGAASVAVYGYEGVCRALAGDGGGRKAVDLYADTDKGHWLSSADLLPDAEGDELVLAGYSGRVILLVREAEETKEKGGDA